MDKFLELVSLTPLTLVAQWCNLLILLVLVKKFLFKPVLNILQQRQDEVDKIYADANKAKEEATPLRADYENRLASAKEEASEIVKTAAAQAQRRSVEIVDEAQEKANALRARAEAEIAQEKKKAINEIKDEISGMAVDIASKVVEREISAKDHEKLIEDFIKNVGEAS
ncbi:MAG: F0F1 ATP synthase subunit B [Oscillospiraceae bacterium]|nr:F0F1 ATP synthase subunit B [Oscillospiraceae bacterium]